LGKSPCNPRDKRLGGPTACLEKKKSFIIASIVQFVVVIAYLNTRCQVHRLCSSKWEDNCE
jgi:hypothetical protein